MVHGNAPSVDNNSTVRTMVVEIGKYGSASGGNKMLITYVIPVDKVHGTTKSVQVSKHKWRNQVAAVEQQVGLFLVCPLHGVMQVGNVIVTIG
jgi:hypothetical protein